MNTLPANIAELLDKRTMLLKELVDTHNEISKSLYAATNGTLKLCIPACDAVQLFHCDGTVSTAKAYIESMADKGEVTLKWRDERHTCYEFTIKGVDCCVLFEHDR